MQSLIVRWVFIGLLCFVGGLACGRTALNDASGGASSSRGSDGGSGGTAQGGGASDSGGTATGGSAGTTTGPLVRQLRVADTNKADILLVVDNSFSMADKQQILAASLPSLTNRLASPLCVDDPFNPTTWQPSPPGGCPTGMALEFPPLSDIHLGVISSSLGGHGSPGGLRATRCSPDHTTFLPPQDDRAHLLAEVREGLSSYQDQGFLKWDPAETARPPGESNLHALNEAFADHVLSAGESGCGYEATLEAWYRFLVEPSPARSVFLNGDIAGPERNPDGTVALDSALLAQRASFLRPDSAVVIIMLSDENDCSVVDFGVGWIVGREARLSRGTTSCNTNPNDPCCRHCGLALLPPPGCARLEDDPNCAAGPHTSATDSLNLRCFNQKLRFGIDLLYPPERYIDGLTQYQVVDLNNCDGPTGSCPLVSNPLYTPSPDVRRSRDPNLVLLAGIVGVPWQDIATEASLAPGAPLKFRSPSNIDWELVLGDPENYVPPTDPLMLEQPQPRVGRHPLLGVPVAPSTSTNPQENPINGHEYAITEFNDLQYACIFPLETPRDCSDGIGACDCGPADAQLNRPLCNPPGGGPAGTVQYFAKAYPGVRHLQVLQSLAGNGVVTSICPKTTSVDPTDPSFGYNPAMSAIVERLAPELRASCLPWQLSVVDGQVPCQPVEAHFNAVDCASEGRETPNAATREAARTYLRNSGLCGEDTEIACGDVSFCAIPQLVADTPEGQACLDGAPSEEVGFCYIDPAQGLGGPSQVAGCDSSQRHLIRFVSAGVPAPGAVPLLVCE